MADLKREADRSESEQSAFVEGRKARAAKHDREDVPAGVNQQYWQFGWDMENARRV